MFLTNQINMKKLYLILAVIGFIAPMIWMMKVTIETGNILLWTDPNATNASAFYDDITTTFMTDLFAVVLFFFIWSYFEAKRLGMKNVWVYWILTMIFGVVGPFPLFLYYREIYLKRPDSGTSGE